MEWDRFQTFGLSSEKSFEMLCNQLFENWCKREYKDSLTTFTVVNGAGGDGGVESYAVLSDETIVGLQAKWFISSVDSNRIDQIKRSITTAIKIRPSITRYIVCVPRDLASSTGRSITNTESSRWDDLVSKMKEVFPNLTIELWNDTRITTEMQKPQSEGIHRYWFTNSEITQGTFDFAFQKARSSWLSTKYVPDLSAVGQIDHYLSNYVGNTLSRHKLAEEFLVIDSICSKLEVAAKELVSLCEKKQSQLINSIIEVSTTAHYIGEKSKQISIILNDEFVKNSYIPEQKEFYFDFRPFTEKIKQSYLYTKYFSHSVDVIKAIEQLTEIGFYDLIESVKACLDNQCLLILGNPGTGKTNGVSSSAENMLKKGFHIPIMVQARNIASQANWKDIVLHALGMSSAWNEDELWQALLSAANRNRFQEIALKSETKLCPKVLIIVDGLDESTYFDRWIDRIKEANVITYKYNNILFCFTSRPAAFTPPIDYASVRRISDEGDVPAYQLFDKYMHAYGIRVSQCPWLRYALNTPLALKLFCETNRGKTIDILNPSDVVINQLWRDRVRIIENEFSAKENFSSKSQFVFRSIITISKLLTDSKQIERDSLVEAIAKETKLDDLRSAELIDHLEKYGIISSFCRRGNSLSLDTHIYSAGIQGFFDYAEALYLLNTYKTPDAIDFSKHPVSIDTLYCLAVMSIQQYKYLITSNSTIDDVADNYDSIELLFYALQHSDNETAMLYRENCKKYMLKNADNLVEVVNKLILPLSRLSGHPLGVSLLDECLSSFSLPAQRDLIWSIPVYLNKSEGQKWWKSDSVTILHDIVNNEYALTEQDSFDGLPIVYAWLLSNVNNLERKKCRIELMNWALKCPAEYYKLFLHFSAVNDPQIRSDLFSILMCVVYDRAGSDLIKDISDWLLANILSPEIIDRERDIAIRYYSIAIINKAIVMGLYSKDAVKKYLPPYKASSNSIVLNRNALSGSRMTGFSAIDYDLSRYVLIDHLTSSFFWKQHHLDALIEEIKKEHTGFESMTVSTFIISAAYNFLLQTGWNENEFFNLHKGEDGSIIGGVDLSIHERCYAASHGAQSETMSVCEKYVWQARNYISGFLSDRLLFGEDQIQLTDYNMLDNFIIPIQEVYQSCHDANLPSNRWYSPNHGADNYLPQIESKEQLCSSIREIEDIDWRNWIQIDNAEKEFPIVSKKLLTLSLFSCKYDPSGIETCLFANSILIPNSQKQLFVQQLHNEELFQRICDPTEWNGGVESSCYITPKEVCWFTWKKHYDPIHKELFPDNTILSAVDRICSNSLESGDTHYQMPSIHIRNLLGIVNTDGYHFYDKDSNVISVFHEAGEKWRTHQEIIVVNEQRLLDSLRENELTLFWIMEELHMPTSHAREKYGDLHAEKRQYYICYIQDGILLTEKILSETV